jgi:hypothetical protein
MSTAYDPAGRRRNCRPWTPAALLGQYALVLDAVARGDAMTRTLILVALLGAVAAPASADCYTVFQRGIIVYRSEVTPIDLEGPIHVAMQKRFPGGQLVISSDVKNCIYIDPSSPVDPTTGAAASAPGSERAGLSVVAGPSMASAAGAAAPAAQEGSVDEGCRRGGTVTRRGEPCPETVAGTQRVVGAEQRAPAAVEAVRAPEVRRR